MKVLYFGTYERDYPRNAHTIALLRRAGVAVVECHVPVWEGRRNAWRAGVPTALRLARAEVRLARRVVGDFDAVVLGYPGHLDVFSARRALADVPLVVNPLVSLTDTLVEDRARFRRGSLAERLLHAVDRRAFSAADLVVADTDAHAELFASLGARRVEVVPVGADERIFHPPWQPDDDARVLFVGKLIPLHGLRTIVDAARLLLDVPFRVVGDGQLAGELHDAPPNVQWVRWVDYEQLGDEYRRAACALGIFGTTSKAGRVIPNKAYHALACGTPLVTAATRAARELVVDGASALLVPPGDPHALAGSLRRLLANGAQRQRLSEGGAEAYRRHASEHVLAARWRDIVERVTR